MVAGSAQAVRAGAGLAVALALVAGVVVLGRVAPNATAAMVLTGAWFVLVLAVAVAVVRRRRELVAPVTAGYGLTAVAALVLLGLPILTDQQVDEQVATGVPVAAAPAAVDPAGAGTGEDAEGAAPPAQPAATEQEAPPPAGNVELGRGSFSALAHPGSGQAALVQLADGGRVLTLTDFATDNGPDLRVYLTTGDPAAGDIGEFVDLGALRGNRGDQQYDLPTDVDVVRYPNVVIWCRAFSVGFTSAPLALAA